MGSICLSLHEYLHVIDSSLRHSLPIQTVLQYYPLCIARSRSLAAIFLMLRNRKIRVGL